MFIEALNYLVSIKFGVNFRNICLWFRPQSHSELLKSTRPYLVAVAGCASLTSQGRIMLEKHWGCLAKSLASLLLCIAKACHTARWHSTAKHQTAAAVGEAVRLYINSLKRCFKTLFSCSIWLSPTLVFVKRCSVLHKLWGFCCILYKRYANFARRLLHGGGGGGNGGKLFHFGTPALHWSCTFDVDFPPFFFFACWVAHLRWRILIKIFHQLH